MRITVYGMSTALVFNHLPYFFHPILLSILSNEIENFQTFLSLCQTYIHIYLYIAMFFLCIYDFNKKYVYKRMENFMFIKRVNDTKLQTIEVI